MIGRVGKVSGRNVFGWKVRNEIGKNAVEKFEPKLESTTEVGK